MALEREVVGDTFDLPAFFLVVMIFFFDININWKLKILSSGLTDYRLKITRPRAERIKQKETVTVLRNRNGFYIYEGLPLSLPNGNTTFSSSLIYLRTKCTN